MSANPIRIEEYAIRQEPYYEPAGNEIDIFEAAAGNGLPVLLKGPTGCGKTRFMEYMSWRLDRPVITVSCHPGAGRPDTAFRGPGTCCR